MWHVFISHAAEDKDSVARPLAEALTRAGYSVWYDEYALRLGDSLGRSIDRGLAESRYGIVVLSPSFFAKAWPRRELDGLTVRELSSGKVILPVWHLVSRAEVERYSPTLADKLGVGTDRGMAFVVQEIVRVLADDPAARAAPPHAGPRPASAAAVPDIDGRWAIAATQRTPKTYLNLRVFDGQVSGTTEMLFSNHPDMLFSGLAAQRRTMILDGRLTNDRVTFTTRRRYVRSYGDPATTADFAQRYEGRIEDRDTIPFAMQVEGGYFEEVTAERVVAAEPASRLVATLEGHQGTVDRMALLPDGRLASASRDRSARVWHLESGRCDQVFEHEGQVHAVVALEGGRLLTADDRDIRVWDLGRGAELSRFQRNADQLVAVLPLAGGRLAGSGAGGRIDIWNVASGRLERSLPADGGATVVTLAQLPDGRLVSGDSDGTIRIRDLPGGGTDVWVRRGERGHGRGVSGLAALPDGRIAASVARRRNAFVWDPASGQEQAIEGARTTLWTGVVAALDDGCLALVDSNDDLTLWNPATARGDVLVNLEDDRHGLASLVQLPGRRYALGMSGGTITIREMQ
jgi:WD40 repeat protein